MQKKFSLPAIFALVFTFIFFNLSPRLEVAELESTEIPNKLDRKTRADLASELNFEMTKDPELGYVPRERLWAATKLLKQQQRRKTKAAIAGINWTERGPSNVSGRTRTMMFDPNDATNKRVFAGSVSGGLWVTDDIYAATTSWTQVDDFLDNMAISSIAYNPVHKDTMYFGTGEGFYNFDAVRGDGIFRSLDGGATWAQLPSTTSSTFSYIQKVVVDAAGNVYAATRSAGVLKSTDHGASWATVLSNSVPATGTNAAINAASDIEIAANGDIYVSMGLIFSSDGIYKSTDGGTSWTRVYAASGEQRIEIACAPSDANYVYAITQDATTRIEKNILRTINGGTSWTSNAAPVGLASQAWYCLSLAVDPNNKTELYAGGLDMWHSTDTANSFTKVSLWNSSPYVHADQHSVVYAPGSSDSILFANDGGVFLTQDGSTTTPAFTFQSNNYNVTQFYSGAIHPTAGENYFLAGSQDNGSQQFTTAAMNATNEVTGGDGGFVFIDQDDPTYQITSYTYNQYRISTNSGASFSNVNFSGSAGKFINPTDYDNDAFILYSSYGNGQYLRWTNPRTGTTNGVVTFSASGTGEPSALFCDPNTANRLYIGTDDGEIWRINSANGTPSATEITGAGMSGYVSSIDVEDGDATHLLATFSSYGVNQVWESTNSGTSWTAIDGNLPDMPVRWGMFNPMGADSVFLATELGVWTTDNVNGGTTNWGASNTGMANVRTDMLQWRDSDSTLIAATHGRGLFSASFSEIVAADFIANNTVVYPQETVSFTDISLGATTWAWDFDNDGTTDATTQNPTWTYTSGGYKTVKLTINGTVTQTKTDYITVIPKLGTPYTAADGGDFESNPWHFASLASSGTNLWERGTPSNHLTTLNSNSNGWKTDLDADCPDASIVCHLCTPSFNMAAAGTYTLAFRKSMEQFYSNAPYCVIVEYSTNSGASWNKLGTSPDANGTNWYANTGLHFSLQSDQIGFLENASNENTSYNVSSLAGNTDVRFRFTYISNGGFTSAGFLDGFMVDDFSLAGPANSPAILPVENVLNASATENLGPNQTVSFISTNNKILATIQNLSSHDYGATTVTIDNAGTSTQNFSTNTAASKQIADKTLLITPTTNNTSGTYRITTYFTNAEATAWKTNTGQSYINFNQIKSPGAISSGTIANTEYGSLPTVDSTYNGSDLAVSATYSTGFSGFGGGLNGSSGSLPATLIEFDGLRINNASELGWKTASELNLNRFEVERLTNDAYEYIGSVNAIGNSKTIKNYTFTDDFSVSQNGLFIYRLKIIDNDGTYEYSNLIRLNELKSEETVSVYPSPASIFIYIDLNEGPQSGVDIQFMNLNGSLIKELTNVSLNQKLDISGFQGGTYFVNISKNGRLIGTRKILVTK